MQKQPPEVFYKKAVLKNFAIFTRKTAVLVFMSVTLLKRDTNSGVFL